MTDIATIGKILRDLDPIQSAVNKLGKCEQPNGDYCLNPDAHRGLGWNQWPVEKMCHGCATYWHLSCAVNELRNLKRRGEISQPSTEGLRSLLP